MSRGIRVLWTFAFLALAIAVTLVVRETLRRRTAEEERQAAVQRREQVRQQLQRAAQRVAQLDQVAAAPVATAPGSVLPAAVKSDAPLVTEMTMTQRDAVMQPEMAVATDPTLRALHLQVFEEEFPGTWGPLLRQLNLSEEKLAAFKALLKTHEEKRLDVTAVAAEGKLRLGDPAVQKMRSQDGATLLQQMRELLGPNDAKIYQQYRRDLELQPLIADMAGRTYFTATPLTFAESEQLRAILSTHTARSAGGFARPNNVGWDAVVAQVEAGRSFSPALVEALRLLANERRLDQKIGERMDAIQAKLGGGTVAEIWFSTLPPLEPRR